MKNRQILKGILASMSVFELLLIGCPTTNNDSDGTDPFEGTWLNEANSSMSLQTGDMKLIAKNELLIVSGKVVGQELTHKEIMKATYSVTESTVTLKRTHINSYS
jgi:hypothetical protein